MVRSERMEFTNAHGEVLAGRFERPAGPTRATALFAHCFTCSKDMAAATRISRELSERGIAVLRFDFTGLGHSEGEFANTNFSSNTDDLVRAAEHLESLGHAPSLLIGHSFGGAAVLRVAPRIPSVRAIATIGAPADLNHLRQQFRCEIAEIESNGSAKVELAGREFEIKKQFLDDLDGQNLLAGLGDLHVATVIFHSPIDNVVGIDNAAKIYAALKHPKSFITLDDADHLLTKKADAEYVADVLAAWADRYLPDAEDPMTTPPGEVVVEQDRGSFLTHVTAGNHRFLADEPRR
ncbi:MAG: alpha/beta fold hydrolase, partial [Planctomycetes bacterium]|nr:alpha/beta fold hydrolase [Planctomycetota bacterium]